MTTDKLRSRLPIRPLMGSIAALLLGSSISQASLPFDTAYWNANPVDGHWTNSSN